MPHEEDVTGRSTPDIRRSTSAEATSQTEQLVRHAYVILTACGRSMSRCKVSRVVRQYQRCVERNGWVFWDFLTNAMMLNEDDRRRYENDPDIYRTITYRDPVGEEAVNNVTRWCRANN